MQTPMTLLYAHSPADIQRYTTDEMRQQFLLPQVFDPGTIRLAYTYNDRLIFGGVTPTDSPLEIILDKQLGVDYFLQRRELGVINTGGDGTIQIDGSRHDMAKYDGCYIGKATSHVVFSSNDPADPARFYVASAPAHMKYPDHAITIADLQPRKVGDKLTLNERKIHMYIHPSVCDACQLQMGLTMLAPGSAWNTMPCHTHARRVEAYMYFDLDDADARVFHIMGAPQATKHLVMADGDAVINPSWSVHCGVGTTNYTFIWAMCGENLTYDDMDILQPSQLR